MRAQTKRSLKELSRDALFHRSLSNGYMFYRQAFQNLEYNLKKRLADIILQHSDVNM